VLAPFTPGRQRQLLKNSFDAARPSEETGNVFKDFDYLRRSEGIDDSGRRFVHSAAMCENIRQVVQLCARTPQVVILLACRRASQEKLGISARSNLPANMLKPSS
jgi:hypothetical protein